MISLVAIPEFVLAVIPGVNQWLFLDKQCRPKIERSGQPEEQQQGDYSDDSDRTNTEIEALSQSGTDAKYPSVLSITIKAPQRSIVNIPGVSTHPFVLHATITLPL
jgi:hypothetical protein